MVTIRFRIIILVMLLVALFSILGFVKRKELQIKYSLVWMVVDILMIIIVAIPRLLDFLAELLGVYSVTNMLFFLGIMVALAIEFSLTLALSRAADRIRKLSQQIGLNEYKSHDKEGSYEKFDEGK